MIERPLQPPDTAEVVEREMYALEAKLRDDPREMVRVSLDRVGQVAWAVR